MLIYKVIKLECIVFDLMANLSHWKMEISESFCYLAIWIAMNFFKLKHQRDFWKSQKKPPEIVGSSLLSRDRWEYIHTSICFDRTWLVVQLNNNFGEQWLLGKELSIGKYSSTSLPFWFFSFSLFSYVDELVDAFRGQSPCRVYIPKKPHPNGHLVYECVSVSRQHSLPFLYRFFPILDGKGLEQGKSWRDYFKMFHHVTFLWIVGFQAKVSGILYCYECG